MTDPQFVNMVVAGQCRLIVRGEGVATVDFNGPTTISGEKELFVSRQANVRVAGQLIAFFVGQGAFVVDEPQRVRVITMAGACVNMTSPVDFHAGGKGIVYAEGVHVGADEVDSVIAVDCPHAHAQDTARLTAIGCGRVVAHGDAVLDCFGAESVMAVERTTLNARDCREVMLDEGQDGDAPRVENLVNCGEPQVVKFDPIAWTEDLGYHHDYVPVEGGEVAISAETPAEPDADGSAGTDTGETHRPTEPPIPA